MGVLDPGSVHARPSTQPPIDTSRIFFVHLYLYDKSCISKCSFDMKYVFIHLRSFRVTSVHLLYLFTPFSRSQCSQLLQNHNSIRIKLIILKMKIFKLFFLFSSLLLRFISYVLLHFIVFLSQPRQAESFFS
jgi:hypothetical protein